MLIVVFTLLQPVDLQAANPQCACLSTTSLVAYSRPRTFVSPNYPNTYCRNMDCAWQITAENSMFVIELKFTYFVLGFNEIGCNRDSVTVRDGNGLSRVLLKECGTTSPKTIRSTGPTLHVSFTSDNYGEFTGFSAEFSKVLKGIQTTPRIPNNGNNGGSGCYCPSVTTLVARTSQASFTSPNHPSPYCSNMVCSWRITANTANHRVVVKFVEFSVGPGISNCPQDHVTIRDGQSAQSPTKEKFCGQWVPESTNSSKNALYVTFVSDSFDTFLGFKAVYYEVKNISTGNSTSAVIIGSTMGGVLIIPTVIIFIIIKSRRDQAARLKARRDIRFENTPNTQRNDDFIELDRPMSNRNQATGPVSSLRNLGDSDPPRNSYRLSQAEPIAQTDVDLPPSYEEAVRG